MSGAGLPYILLLCKYYCESHHMMLSVTVVSRVWCAARIVVHIAVHSSVSVAGWPLYLCRMCMYTCITSEINEGEHGSFEQYVPHPLRRLRHTIVIH